MVRILEQLELIETLLKTIPNFKVVKTCGKNGFDSLTTSNLTNDTIFINVKGTVITDYFSDSYNTNKDRYDIYIIMKASSPSAFPTEVIEAVETVRNKLTETYVFEDYRGITLSEWYIEELAGNKYGITFRIN
jgi:hypothetical protein